MSQSPANAHVKVREAEVFFEVNPRHEQSLSNQIM